MLILLLFFHSEVKGWGHAELGNLSFHQGPADV